MGDIRRIQLLKLEMLKKFSSVCEKHGIVWFADGGTLLGAVRHGAFIPWDDDIDVAVPREGYRTLCRVDQDEFSPYFMQWLGSDWEAARGHVQIRNSDTTEILLCDMANNGKSKHRFNQGLFIDVFPIDYIPYGWKDIGLGDRLWTMKSGAWDARDDRRKCEGLQREHEQLSGSCKDSHLMDTIAVNFVPKQFTPSCCFDDHVNMKFEDMEVPVPQGYECRLWHLYGKDWRTPRKEPTFHGGTFVDLDRPYTYYLP